MNLTNPTQRTALATDINAQGSLATARAGHDVPFIIAFYAGAGAVTLWRNDVSVDQVKGVIGMGEFVALTAIKQNGLLLLTQGSLIDATLATTRASFAAIFSAGATLTALTALAIRTATKFEALFTNGAAVAGSFLMQNDADGVSLLNQRLDAETVRVAMGWQ